MKLKNLMEAAYKMLAKRSPELLVATGIGLMGVSVCLAVKNTPTAVYTLNGKKFEENRELTVQEKIKTAYKFYVPSAVAFGAGAACIIFADSVHLKRNAALMTAASVAERAFKNYSEEVIAELGEEKEREIKQKVASKKESDARDAKQEAYSYPIGNPNGNTVKCFESLTGRYFWSNKNSIERAENEFNRQMRNDVTLSENEWFGYLGLDEVKNGDLLGWDIDRGGYLNIFWNSKLDDKGDPVLVIDYTNPPSYIGY